MGGVRPAQAPAAGATVVFRNVGISLGVALGGAIYAGAEPAADIVRATDGFRAASLTFAAVAGAGLLIAFAASPPRRRIARRGPLPQGS